MRIHFKDKATFITQPQKLIELDDYYNLRPLRLSLYPQAGAMSIRIHKGRERINSDEFYEREIAWVVPGYTDARSVIAWAEGPGKPLLKTICANHTLIVNPEGYQTGVITPAGRNAIGTIAHLCEQQAEEDETKRPFTSWNILEARDYIYGPHWQKWNLEPGMSIDRIKRLSRKIITEAAKEDITLIDKDVTETLIGYTSALAALVTEA